MVKLILHRKRIHENGAIEESIVWVVPKSVKSPEGVRYRLAYIPKGEMKPSILFDNHHPKGHHKHIGSREMPYDYSTIEKLLIDFDGNVEEAKRHENI